MQCLILGMQLEYTDMYKMVIDAVLSTMLDIVFRRVDCITKYSPCPGRIVDSPLTCISQPGMNFTDGAGHWNFEIVFVTKLTHSFLYQAHIIPQVCICKQLGTFYYIPRLFLHELVGINSYWFCTQLTRSHKMRVKLHVHV